MHVCSWDLWVVYAGRECSSLHVCECERTQDVYVCVFFWQWSVSGEAGLAWEHCCRSVSERRLLKVWWSVCVCVCVCVCWAWIVPPKGGRESGLSQPSLSAWSCRSYECMRPVFIWGAHGKSDCGHFESKKLGEARWTFSSEIKRRVGGERCVCVCTQVLVWATEHKLSVCVRVCSTTLLSWHCPLSVFTLTAGLSKRPFS